ncbi:MAG: threonine--tRNA ligase [Candidatus Levybacteria bacterium]|nr:threonine--tRNA ligase [Candidatus Levybacteria bacterium]
MEKMRHSAAHVLAQAVVQYLGSTVKLGIGPAIEDGFYYDFELPRSLAPEDLREIEKLMSRIVEADLPFVREELPKAEARKLFAQLAQTYKVELIDDIPDEVVSVYRQGDFVDLCRGPHVESTGKIGAFKLLSVAGAYWRGDSDRPMLQRIYGTTFPTAEELQGHLERLEEAGRRDHRRLGRELDLFSVSDEVGPGLILWHPKGAMVRKVIEDFWRAEHIRRDYDLVNTPHVGRLDLWKTSGHWDWYRENMFPPMNIDDQEYLLKPMNCPFHIMIYKSDLRSYRDLPLRWGELGTVYRYERSGVLHGMLRVRGFTQDDAHIICTPDQIESEVREVLRFSLSLWHSFGFKDIRAYLATRPPKAVGEPSRWETAIESLKRAVSAENLQCEVDEGGGAFYGPKIDLKIKDALGREWQMTTIQFDFNLPERFDMTFVGSDGGKHRPFMVHRALLGSLERFFGVLISNNSSTRGRPWVTSLITIPPKCLTLIVSWVPGSPID